MLTYASPPLLQPTLASAPGPSRLLQPMQDLRVEPQQQSRSVSTCVSAPATEQVSQHLRVSLSNRQQSRLVSTCVSARATEQVSQHLRVGLSKRAGQSAQVDVHYLLVVIICCNFLLFHGSLNITTSVNIQSGELLHVSFCVQPLGPSTCERRRLVREASGASTGDPNSHGAIDGLKFCKALQQPTSPTRACHCQ